MEESIRRIEMNLELTLKLQKKIVEWMDENCEDMVIWPEMYVGESLHKNMTDAATSVFDAVEDIQKYLKENRYLED